MAKKNSCYRLFKVLKRITIYTSKIKRIPNGFYILASNDFSLKKKGKEVNIYPHRQDFLCSGDPYYVLYTALLIS
jgi:hypothetical protein